MIHNSTLMKGKGTDMKILNKEISNEEMKISWLSQPRKLITMIAMTVLSVLIVCQPVKAEGSWVDEGNEFVLSLGETTSKTYNALQGINISNVVLHDSNDPGTSATFNGNTITIVVGFNETIDHQESSDGKSFSITFEFPNNPINTIFVQLQPAPQKTVATTGSDEEYVEYTPPTPEELETIRLNNSFVNGYSRLSVGGSEAFMEFGQKGESASLWQAGVKIGSFQLTDANGKSVKMQLLGIKTIGKEKYMNLIAYSKAGGYQLDIDDNMREQLKKAGITGIMFGTTKIKL